LIKLQRDGKLPLEKISKFYKVSSEEHVSRRGVKLMMIQADDFEKAVHDMHTGETIKPIILW
jgi:Zn-dependent alcohol dehydrogenase